MLGGDSVGQESDNAGHFGVIREEVTAYMRRIRRGRSRYAGSYRVERLGSEAPRPEATSVAVGMGEAWISDRGDLVRIPYRPFTSAGSFRGVLRDALTRAR